MKRQGKATWIDAQPRFDFPLPFNCLGAGCALPTVGHPQCKSSPPLIPYSYGRNRNKQNRNRGGESGWGRDIDGTRSGRGIPYRVERLEPQRGQRHSSAGVWWSGDTTK